MEQYIPKSALVAEIEKLESRFQNGSDEDYADGYHYSLKLVKRILDTLEVKEVNLDREIRRYEMRNPIIHHREESLYDYMANVAKHFFELGLKAKDLKKERMEECPYRQIGCTMYDGKILECTGACSWVVDYLKSKELKAQKGE